MIIIHSKELVIFFSTDFMADSLSIDNGCHLVLAFCFRWMNHNIVNLDLSSMCPFPIPSLVLIDIGKVITINDGCFVVIDVWNDMTLNICLLYSMEYGMFLFNTLLQFFVDGWVQSYRDTLVTIEHIHINTLYKVVFDNGIDNLKTLF